MKELRLIEMMGNIDEKLLLRANAPVPLFGKPRFRAAFAAAVVAALLAITMIASPVAMAVSYGNAHPEIEGGLVYVMDAMIKDEDHFLNSLLPEGVKNTLGSVFDALKGEKEENESESDSETETEPEFVMPPASQGLKLELNAENTGYRVMGMGSCKDKHVVIPAEYNGLPVTEIYYNRTHGDKAFEGNTRIESLIIPASVQSINDFAFYKCTSLKSVMIEPGEQPLTIGNCAFSGCALEEFSTGDNVTRFHDPFGFANTDTTYEKTFPQVTEYDNAYYVGSKDNPYHVLVRIKDTALTSCEIHPDTKIIGGGAFYMSALTEIDIPEGVTAIERKAFAQTEAMTRFSFPDSLFFVGADAFLNCAATINTSEYGTGDEYVGDEENPYLILVGGDLPLREETRYIPDNAFLTERFSPNLTSITIPAGVRYIGDYAFQSEKSSLNKLTSLTVLGDGLYIGHHAFAGLDRLTELTIGAGVTYITPNTFNMLPLLSTITVEQGNPVYASIGNCLIEKESGTLIRAARNATLSNDGSIKHIAAGAYWGIASNELPSNPIPEGVLTIGEFALYNYHSNRATTPLMIPSTITSISQHTFASAGTIHYNGTKEQFTKLLNKIILNGTVICTDGEIQISSN